MIIRVYATGIDTAGNPSLIIDHEPFFDAIGTPDHWQLVSQIELDSGDIKKLATKAEMINLGDQQIELASRMAKMESDNA